MVIHNYISNIDITFERMNCMAHTDGKGITVTTTNHYIHIFIRQFHTLCIWKCTTMCSMRTIGIEVTTDTARATDTRDNRQFFRRNIKCCYCISDSCLHPIVTTTWAPVRADVISILICCCHYKTSLIAAFT